MNEIQLEMLLMVTAAAKRSGVADDPVGHETAVAASADR